MPTRRPNDTDPRADAIIIEGFRAMPPREKLRIVGALSRTVRELALVDVRNRFPDDSEREQLLRAASRWLEPQVMKQTFDWDVDKRGY